MNQKKCIYQFIAGKKKGSQCGRFCRKTDKEFCYAHRKYTEDTTPVEPNET